MEGGGRGGGENGSLDRGVHAGYRDDDRDSIDGINDVGGGSIPNDGGENGAWTGAEVHAQEVEMQRYHEWHSEK